MCERRSGRSWSAAPPPGEAGARPPRANCALVLGPAPPQDPWRGPGSPGVGIATAPGALVLPGSRARGWAHRVHYVHIGLLGPPLVPRCCGATTGLAQHSRSGQFQRNRGPERVGRGGEWARAKSERAWHICREHERSCTGSFPMWHSVSILSIASGRAHPLRREGCIETQYTLAAVRGSGHPGRVCGALSLPVASPWPARPRRPFSGGARRPSCEGGFEVP